jgi:hypothetical protein
MSISYKPLVERFDIPRPTLIEWQKRAEVEGDNWRVRHLSYLRTQLWVEEETLKEIRRFSPCSEDLFILCVYFFFHNITTFIPPQPLRKGLREFSLHLRTGVEYQHEFAQRIWSLRVGDDSNRCIVNYHRVFDLLDKLSSAQYALVIETTLLFLKSVKKRYSIGTKTVLEGKTWQELYMYDKAFSLKAIEEFFQKKGILEQKA